MNSFEPDQDRPVTLATSKHQEVFTYSRPVFEKGSTGADRTTYPDLDPTFDPTYPFYCPAPLKAFADLPYVRPSVLYIFGSKSPLSKPDWRKQKMQCTGTGLGGNGGAQEGRVKEVVLEDTGHLIPMENVGGAANASAEWLIEEFEKWRLSEDAWKRRWTAMSRTDKTMISEEWKRRLGGDPRGKKLEKL